MVSVVAVFFVISYDSSTRGSTVIATADRGVAEPTQWGPKFVVLFCTYSDHAGQVHRARAPLLNLLHPLQDVSNKAIAADNKINPFPCRIAGYYDPRWPNRFWVAPGAVLHDDVPSREDDNMLMLSIVPMLLGFVALFAMVFVFFPFELNLVVPFAVQVGFWIALAFLAPSLRLT